MKMVVQFNYSRKKRLQLIHQLRVYVCGWQIPQAIGSISVNYVIHLHNSVILINHSESTFIDKLNHHLSTPKMINSIAHSLPLNYLDPIPVVNVLICKKNKEKRLKNHYTDLAIVDGIRVRDIRVINYLYDKFYLQITNMVRVNSGSKMDAEDLFQDALIVIFQKISAGRLELLSSFNTYLYSICWHIWLQKLNKRPFKYEYKALSDQDAEEDEKEMMEIVKESERYSLFREHFLRLRLAEQKVLRLYLDNTSSNDVAVIMGYKSGNYAKFRKYICKERLKKSIIHDPKFLALSQF